MTLARSALHFRRWLYVPAARGTLLNLHQRLAQLQKSAPNKDRHDLDSKTVQPSLFALAEPQKSHGAGQKSGPPDTASRLKLQADSPKQTCRKVVSLH